MNEQREFFKITVSDNGMKAVLEPVPGAGAVPDMETLLDLLKKNNITFGVDKERLQSIIQDEKPLAGGIVIARGTPPEPGLDAELIVCFRETGESGAIPEGSVGEDGMFQLENCKVAKKNEVLVVKLRKTDGKAGKDVFGNEIAAPPGKDVTLDAGKNVQKRFYPDKIEYSALCEGIVNLTDARIEVNSLCIIDHDVDLSTGNIEFVGSLLILGNVNRGFKVTSQGSITIQGKVDGGILTAEGDIIVAQSVSGSSDLRAGGNIKAKFIEHSRLESEGDIEVSDGILHCDVTCSGRVIVMKGRGVIAGGIIKANDRIEAREVGASLGTPTQIIIGEKLIGSRKILRLESELNSLEQEIQRLQSTLRPFVGKDPTLGTLPSDKRWALKSLAKRLREMRSRRNFIRQKLATTNQLAPLRKTAPAQLIVHRDIHPGVNLKIGKARMDIDHELSHVVFMQSKKSGALSVVNLDDVVQGG